MNATVESTLRTDPVMADLIDEYGPLTVEPADDPFRRLCISIINQQLSTASATAIRERVFAHLESVTPERILAADPDPLLTAGLSQTKVTYLQAAAEAFQERDLSRAALEARSNDDIVEDLTTIQGIGPWTAEMFLIFVLGREDVLPLDDLAVRRGFEQCYGADLTRADMRSIAEDWRPYRSYGTRYLWTDYESD